MYCRCMLDVVMQRTFPPFRLSKIQYNKRQNISFFCSLHQKKLSADEVVDSKMYSRWRISIMGVMDAHFLAQINAECKCHRKRYNTIVQVSRCTVQYIYCMLFF